MYVKLGIWSATPNVRIRAAYAVELADGSYIARAEIYKRILRSEKFAIRNPEFLKKNKIAYSTFEKGYVFKEQCIRAHDRQGNRHLMFPEHAIRTTDGNYFLDNEAAEYNGYVRYNNSWTRMEPNAGYHSLARKNKSRNADVTVGVEIEKEDRQAYKIPYAPIYDKLGWCKEYDVSLGSCGFELVSPIFNLYSDTIEKDIEELKDLIDAGYSRSCGGHINIAKKGMNAIELLKEIKGYLPLLYALYPSRCTNGYSYARPFSSYTHATKGSAVSIKGNVLELRIFPAVENRRDLIWRLNLLRFMLKNPLKSVRGLEKMMEQPELKELIGRKKLNVSKYYDLCA